MSVTVRGTQAPGARGMVPGEFFDPIDLTFAHVAYHRKENPDPSLPVPTTWFGASIIIDRSYIAHPSAPTQEGRDPRRNVYCIQTVKGSRRELPDHEIVAIDEVEYDRLKAGEEEVYWPAYETFLRRYPQLRHVANRPPLQPEEYQFFAHKHAIETVAIQEVYRKEKQTRPLSIAKAAKIVQLGLGAKVAKRVAEEQAEQAALALSVPPPVPEKDEAPAGEEGDIPEFEGGEADGEAAAPQEPPESIEEQRRKRAFSVRATKDMIRNKSVRADRFKGGRGMDPAPPMPAIDSTMLAAAQFAGAMRGRGGDTNGSHTSSDSLSAQAGLFGTTGPRRTPSGASHVSRASFASTHSRVPSTGRSTPGPNDVDDLFDIPPPPDELQVPPVAIPPRGGSLEASPSSRGVSLSDGPPPVPPPSSRNYMQGRHTSSSSIASRFGGGVSLTDSAPPPGTAYAHRGGGMSVSSRHGVSLTDSNPPPDAQYARSSGRSSRQSAYGGSAQWQDGGFATGGGVHIPERDSSRASISSYYASTSHVHYEKSVAFSDGTQQPVQGHYREKSVGLPEGAQAPYTASLARGDSGASTTSRQSVRSGFTLTDDGPTGRETSPVGSSAGLRRSQRSGHAPSRSRRSIASVYMSNQYEDLR